MKDWRQGESDVIDGSLQEAGDVKAMAKATVESDVIDGSLQEAGESDETGGRKRKMTTRCQSEKWQQSVKMI